ncbi:MAG: TonB-dependent receptor plug domain-containing protein [Candidatus Polarisedimenticolia bacterium]
MTAEGLVLLLLLSESGAAAGDLPPETVLVDAEAGRAPTDAAAFSTFINVRDHAARGTTVPELLAQAVGLHMRALGGAGSYATASIRGSTAEQVNVYVDGVLMNHAAGGGIDLSGLPADQIETIEVYRGVTPAWLEGSAIGGAISIRTRDGAQTAGGSGEASVSYGSYDTAQAAASGSWSGVGPGQALDTLVSFSGDTTQGDFVFYDNNGTAFDGSDDGYEQRVNNASWRADLLGRVGARLASGARLELEADVGRRRQGVPGVDAAQSETARSDGETIWARAGWSHPGLLQGRLRTEAGLSWSRARHTFSDGGGDVTGGTSTEARDILDAIAPSAVLRWRPRSQGSVRHHVTLLGSWRLETAERFDEVLPQEDRGDTARTTWQASLEDEIQIAGGRLAFVPSVRWLATSSSLDAPSGVPVPELPADDDAAWTGRLGVAWRPSSSWTARANVGRFHRQPSFTELFGNQGAIRPSIGLAPEQGLNADLGVSWERTNHGALQRLAIEGALFHTQADDLIQLVQTSQSQVTARNTGRAEISGAELSVALAFTNGLSGDANYTYQRAVDRSGRFTDGSDLPGRPRHELSAAARLTRGWGRLFYEFTWIGPYFVDAAAAALGASGSGTGDLQIPGRYLHDVGYTGSLGSRWEYTLEVDNVGDIRTVDLVRYPLPGRTAHARLRVTFP